MLKRKSYIPQYLIPVLIIFFLASLITYYKISQSPRIEDLFIGFAATILGILITVLFVDRIIIHNEKKEWQEFEGIISNQIIDLIFTLCNFLSISSTLWKQHLEIFKEDVDTRNKIIKYIDFFNSSEINLDYIKHIVNDNHLIAFFSDGYSGVLRSLTNIYSSYSHKLSADQSTQIINLKSNLSILINNMNTFRMLNVAIKEFNASLETGYLNDFKENVCKTVFVANKLLDAI